MNIELILLGVIGAVFLVDFILNSIRKKSVKSTEIDHFDGSKPLSKKGGLNYILKRKKNISLAILLVPVIKVAIHYIVYTERTIGIRYGYGWSDSRNKSLRWHIDHLFSDELWLFIPSLFLVLFFSWFFNEKIKAR